MSAIDPFEGLRVPRPPRGLRERVLQAAAGAGGHRDEPLLDRLWGSRAWWLGWAAAVLLLLLLQSAPPAGGGDRSGVRQWQERLRRVEAELGFDGVRVEERHAGGRGESV